MLVFLGALAAMDSFKLVRLPQIVMAMTAGGVAALIAYLLHPFVLQAGVTPKSIDRYLAPLVEELLKGGFIFLVIAGRRVGFPVDAAIQGFAVGTGFALVENVVYVSARPDAPLMLWIVRGLGTAILHGSTTAVFAIVSQRFAARQGARAARAFAPGLLLAIAMHMAFNGAVLPPVAEMLVLLIAVPLIVVSVFEWSERSTREWVGAGLDLDVQLLDLVSSDAFDATHYGAYLRQVRSRFPGPVVADMFCLLRLQLELSAEAKGVLIARSAGIDLAPDADTTIALAELEYLRRSIGRTGLLALEPLSVTTDRDAWHGYLVRGRVKPR